MTVTVTGASQSGHVTVLPTAADTGGVPVSSTVNFVAGSTRANQAVDAVTLDAARSVSVYAAVSTHVIIDVVGYVTGPSSPVSQTGLFRLLEVPVSIGSRLAIPAAPAGTGFDVAGRAGVDTDAVGVALLAVVSNRTATTSNVAVVADGTTFPGVSSLNPAPGERTAIAVTSGLSSGRVRVVSTQVVDVELFAVGVYVTSITPTITAVSGVGPGVLGFDPLGRLTSTTTGGVTVGYSYLADGTRVAARTQGGGEVYYLGGIEATRTSGVWSQVRRTYPYAGVTIASRTSTATGTGVSWLLGDRQGSVTTTITTGAVSTRWYRPYGAARGPSPASPVVTTGFLGKHEDPSGLTHLDHRDYDPTTGTFITIDPLVATTGEPYQYATGNPTTLSDPTGLTPCDPSEEFGCGPIMDEPSRICAVAPTWPGCGKASPQTNEVQRWVDTCQGSWTYCNNLVTQGGIYDNPAAWRAYVALMMLLRLGYLEVRGNGSAQDYLFANTSLLPEGSDNVRVVVGSDSFGGTGFTLEPIAFMAPFEGCGWACAIATVTTAIVSYATAGTLCAGATVATLGFAGSVVCTGGWLAATGTTNVVYEATSRDNETLGDLGCAFFFGPSNGVAGGVITASAGGSLFGAIKDVAGSLLADQVRQEVGVC
jgi:RHS repeat-associated protein